eukprot:TRINITY_DN18933_c0_g1_i1.p2 TRINITY_DN18933_c0_g1~~TRINITY_DN18933_c0_g1_i1.p2  ORF type:complete len:128 (+),score=27.81 TRINITY_DN18933_c0_g1_i1:81-464(+)
MGLFGGKKKAAPIEEAAEVRTAESSTSAPLEKPKEVERSSGATPNVAEASEKVEDEILAGVLEGTKRKKKKEKKLELTTSVFEFGSAGGNKGLTLAGFCPISDEHEPCKWEVIEDGGAEQPAIRIIF